jgi:hypothetical protein
MKKLIIGCGLRDGLFCLDAYKDFKQLKLDIQNKDLIVKHDSNEVAYLNKINNELFAYASTKK